MSNSHSAGAPGTGRDEDELARLVEELSRRIEYGDQSGVNDLLEENPDHQFALRDILPTMQALAEFENELAEPAQSTESRAISDTPEIRPCIGDFRLVREIGRGGMGVVYEAFQLSMQRTVALKVLPFAALAGEKPLRRFHNEVRAAALLDHPHIVPVFSVGEERGIHYYAMQYVRGQSLAAVIADLRAERNATSRVNRAVSEIASNGGDLSSQDVEAAANSTLRNAGYSTSALGRRNDYFRTVARLGIQAAEAIQHAHEHGVVHRDIKPANLLLDAAGQLRVTDFGLASIESDANLTATGELAGTLRYMSPEQALGRRDALDHRTDVYSLGATLYELLTLQPAFVADDRAELLQQICHTDPRPPREFDSAIPADLETILLKTIEKEPTDRYSSAADLAEDLRRFAVGQTIRAKRPSLFDRTSKWAQRNRSVVATSFVMALALCVMLASSTVVVWRAKLNTQLALEESQDYASKVEDLLYAADIQHAYQALNEQRTDQVRKILDRYRPVTAGRDIPGFEWRLLETLTKPPTSTVLGQHTGSVNEIAVFPDGQRLASVGDDGKLRIWQIDAGTLLSTIDTGNRPLHSVAVSPDGRTIATGSVIVQLWSVASGEREMLLTEHETNVEAITFSPDGKSIVTGARYGPVRLFSRNGELIKEIEDESRHYTLGFTADGTRLLVPAKVTQADGSTKTMIQIWRSDLSTVERELDKFGYDFGIAFPGGSYYLAGDHHSTVSECVILTETGEHLLNLSVYGDAVTAIAISSQERFIAAGFDDGNVSCWRIARNAVGLPKASSRSLSIMAHEGRVHSIQFTGPERMVTCGNDGLIKVWRLPAKENPQHIGENPSKTVAVSRDGSIVATTRGEDNTTLQLMTADGDLIRQVESDSNRPEVLAFAPDNEYLATATLDQLHLRNSRTGEVVRDILLGSPVKDICFSPSGKSLAIVTRDRAARLHLLSLDQLSVCSTVSFRVDGDYKCEYSPSGSHLVCVGKKGINVFNAETLAIMQQTSTASDPRCLGINKQGTALATGHVNGTLRLWELPSLKLQGELLGHESAITGIAFSPDGQSLVSVSRDSTVRLWSAVNQRACGIIGRPGVGEIHDVAFSPDGRRIYVAPQVGGLTIYTVE